MKPARLVTVLLILAAGIGTLFLSSGTAIAQTSTNNNFTPPPYNPYPPGILPPDLVPEIARVQREVATIENEAIQQWHAFAGSDIDRSTPNSSGNGTESESVTRKTDEFRPQHVAL